MRVEYSKKFIKQYKKSPNLVKKRLKERIRLYCQDSNSPVLNNHNLRGKWKGFRSINITGDWRAIFKEIKRNKVVRFYFIGTHSQLYG